MSKEIRKTDPKTGAQKGTKLERHDLFASESLRRLATHFGVGAQKYDEHNWRKGYAWSWSYAALQRHLWAFWGGEDIDEETGSRHIISAMWHCMALDTFMDEHPELDDRFVKPKMVDSVIQTCLDQMMLSSEEDNFANELLEKLTETKVEITWIGATGLQDSRRKHWNDWANSNGYVYAVS